MPLSGSQPVLNCSEAKAWEAVLMVNEADEWLAMESAGASLAEAIVEDFKEIGGLPAKARILAVVGKGHNGGDALLALRALLSRFKEAFVEVWLCFGEEAMRPLARRALDILRNDFGSRLSEQTSHFEVPAGTEVWDLCLDGIFGFQFRTPLDQETARLIAMVNVLPGIRFRAAVDLPSGVGENNATTLFRADFTYATGIVKHPLLSSDVAASVGRLRYLDLGFFKKTWPDDVSCADRILTKDVLVPLAGLRASQTDKRTYGHLFVVGGSRSYPGAVVLAVRAALRSGAGLVTAFVPEHLVPEYAARHPEAMWVGCPETATGGLAAGAASMIRLRWERATSLLIGPGLGAEEETIDWVGQIVGESRVPLILDADALRPEVVAVVGDVPLICTPHAGEYKRLGGRTGLRRTTGANPSSPVVAVLKGPLTRIVSASGRSEIGPTYYSPFGGPVLARGGSGDLLAGLIGGLLAQQPSDPLLAACRGVVWHGRAADLLARSRGQVAVEISEILEQLGPALLP